MAAPNWSKLPPLIEDVLAHAPSYGLFPALAAVERAWASRGEVGNGLDRWLRVEPHADLVFPPADLRSARLDEAGVLRLQANLLGLYGVDAPMPHYLLEAAAREDEVGERLRALLDLFNHRLYSLLYQAWKAGSAVTDPTGSAYAGYAAALDGGGEGPSRSAVLGRRRPSATALAAALAEELALPVAVQDGIPQWLDVPARPALGAPEAPSLGGNALLGDRLRVAGERVDVAIGPLPLAEALALLPGQARGQRLQAMIRSRLGPAAPFDLLLRVRPDRSAAASLSAEGLPLGWSTWLGEPAAEEITIRVTAGRRLAAAAQPGNG